MNSKKSNISCILLSAVALLVIVSVAVGITYSWIEGGTTYSMQTENSDDLKTGSAPENAKYSGKVILDPASTTPLNLADYDETSNQHQALYFSPVSSTDGKNFFFPAAYDTDGNPASYREATTNDIGTKFIKFDFDIEAKDKCYLAFNGKPAITVTKSGSPVTDTSAFRIMISDGTTAGTHIFSTADTAQSSNAVNSIDTDADTFTTETLTTETFDKFLNNTSTQNRLFEYEAGDTGNISVSVWLDSEAAASSDLFGCDVTVDIDLIVDQPEVPVHFNAVTVDNEGNIMTNGFAGGKIDGNTVAFTRDVVVGESFSVTAAANTNYKFTGWYSDESCETLVSSSATLSKTPTEEVTYYAKFEEKPQYTISVSSLTVPEGTGTGGTVTVNSSGTTYTGYEGTTTTITATAADGYSFVAWYTNAECTGSPAYSTASKTITISADTTYYAKFAKKYPVTISTMVDGVVGATGGQVNIQAAAISGKTTVTSSAYYYGRNIGLYAAPDEGYKFTGIYDASGNLIKATSPASVTVSDTDNTYYAYFEKIPASTTTIYVEARSSISTYSLWVFSNANGVSSYNENKTWPGDTATLDSTTGYYKYQFTTTDTGSFNVILSNGGSSQDAELEGTLGKSYLLTADNELVEFDPADMLTFKVSATPSASGTVTVNGGTSVKIRSGGSVTLNATPASGYKFVGWYTNSGCTSTIGTTYKTASQTISVTGTAGSTVTYYAKFEEQTEITIYFSDNQSWGSVYCHYWGGSTSTTWPGKAMTKVGTNEYSQTVYSVTIPADTTGIIFTKGNSGPQTVDITTNIADGKGFYLVSESGGKWTVSAYDY